MTSRLDKGADAVPRWMTTDLVQVEGGVQPRLAFSSVKLSLPGGGKGWQGVLHQGRRGSRPIFSFAGGGLRTRLANPSPPHLPDPTPRSSPSWSCPPAAPPPVTLWDHYTSLASASFTAGASYQDLFMSVRSVPADKRLRNSCSSCCLACGGGERRQRYRNVS